MRAGIRQLIMDGDNIDGAIRIFNPDIDLTDIRPRTVPRSHVAFLGGSRTDRRRATEVDVAVHALNRMLEFGRPISVRIA